MSRKDYLQSLTYYKPEDTFDALIMAAIEKAEGNPLERLERAWREFLEEIEKRTRSDDGYLPGEVHDEDLTPASNDDTDPFAERQAERDTAPPASVARREDMPGYR